MAGFGFDVDDIVKQIEDRFGAGLARGEPKRPKRWHKPILSLAFMRVLTEAERRLSVVVVGGWWAIAGCRAIKPRVGVDDVERSG